MCCVNTYSATLNSLQRNFTFSATFNVSGLRVSDILLAHTHTHTHTHTFRHLSLGFFLRAREAQCIPYKQRAQAGSLCSNFYTLLSNTQEVNNNILIRKQNNKRNEKGRVKAVGIHPAPNQSD